MNSHYNPCHYQTDVTHVTLGPLSRNPNRNGWHYHTSLKLFWPKLKELYTTATLMN